MHSPGPMTCKNGPFLTLLLWLLGLSAGPHTHGVERFVYERAEMAVPFRISLYAPDEATAKSAAEAAFDRVAVLNSIFSDYDSDTELSRLSRTSGRGMEIPLSDELRRRLGGAQWAGAGSRG